MTLDQQLNEIISAARRQLTALFDERMNSLAGEIGQAATSDRTAAIREVRLAAEAEIVKRSQEAVAGAQAESAKRMQEALAAAQASAAMRTQEAVAAVQAEAVRRADEAITAVRAELAKRSDEAAAAARSEAAATARAESARQIEGAVAAARADADRLQSAAVDAVRAEVAKQAAEAAAAVDAVRADLAMQIEEAVAAARAEADARYAAAVESAQADLTRRIDEAAATARTAALSAARVEAEQRIAAAVAAARRDAEESARRMASQTVIESQAAARQSELAQIDRVVEAVRRFDQARSLTDVLEALGDVMSREAPRVALFLVRGGRLAGWRATGFGPAIDPRAIEVANDESSLLWRAIASGLALSTTDAASGERWTTPFGQLGHDAAGLAVPVRVGGETVAVVYADDATDGPRAVPSAWPEVVEVLARHAGRCLEVLTMSRSASSAAAAPPRPAAPRGVPPERLAPAPRPEDDESARRYARLLVSEIKLYHEAAVTEGRHGHNLVERLGSEIERARKLYEERVPVEIRNRADHFGQELVRTLANGDSTLLGASRP